MSLATSTDHPAIEKARKIGTTKVSKASGDRSPVATGRKPGKKALGKRKASFFLSPDIIRRLGITAVAEGQDTSDVVESILSQAPALKRWRLHDMAKPSDQATVEVSSD
jgi:hypothetical protein